MRISKTTAILLGVVIVLLVILGVFFFKVGLTTPQMMKKVCLMICAVLIFFLSGLLIYLLLLSRDKEQNYFLFDRNTGKNMSLDALTFPVINEKMSLYIAVNFENAEKLWLSNAWSCGDKFGVNGVYRGILAYKMLYDLAEADRVEQWNRFVCASDETVTYLCHALMRCGERDLAQKLIYLKQHCGSEISPIRSLILGNKLYLSRKMTALVKRNIEWFYQT